MEELKLTKNLHTLTIDPEFRDLIPSPSDEERVLLEDSIVANGCESPLFIWNGVIVDGHNRYEICQRHNIPFAVVEKDFADRNAALMWIIQTQLGRRNLTSYQKGELALRFEKALKIPAAERQEDSRFGSDSTVVPNLAPPLVAGKTRDLLSKHAGISHGTMDKVKKLVASADADTKQKLRRGDVSIHKAYTDLMHKEHDGETKICERCHQEKPVADFNIPSKHRAFSALCKQCEAEVAATAKEAERVASSTSEPAVTMPVPEATEAHKLKRNFSTLGELRDLPEYFPKVAELFRRTLDSCYNGIDINLRQYKPSMVSEENTACLRAMIVSSFEETLEVFDSFIARTYGDHITE